jgi:ribosomal protein S18 acetylase RimI-like enzyme
MQLRTMTETDIPAGMRLKELAGWNQTRADWERFLSASPRGCFVADVDGCVRGTATTICYENRFAWVGMVLVDPAYRSRGIGTKLLERAIEHLDQQRVPTIKLDATPHGKPLYEKLGFVSEYEIERWTLKRPAAAIATAADRTEEETLPPQLLDFLCKADREVFGADRASLLKSLHAHAPSLTAGIWNSGAFEGYAFARQGSFADHLGPWIATNAGTARQLLEEFTTHSRREILIADCLKSNSFALDLLQSFGFTHSRLLTRMYRGPNVFRGRPELLCSIMGPEFG